MAYIGNTVENQGFTPAIDYFNGNGVTVTFTLSRSVASVAQVIVAIDNVIQNPNSSFTVAGNAITFSSAPLSGTNNIWVEYTSLITTYQAISQDPTVIGDIRATGGYLAEGDFGNSFVDGAILDYVTGLGRITVGDLDGLTIYNGGTAARTALLTLASSGDAAIGTTSSLFATANRRVLAVNGTSSALMSLSVGSSTSTAAYMFYSNPNLSITNATTGGIINFSTENTERMRIDSSGNLCVGTTTSSARFTLHSDGSSTMPMRVNNTAAGAGSVTVIGIQRNSSTTGTIANTDAVTSYNTTSDYRLKEDVSPMVGALDKVTQLKPVTYKWKSNGSDGQGFIAHELQTVVPDCVTGEKDAVDAEGKPVYQGIDTSFLVATLTAAIQELKATVDAQAARIAALENPPVESAPNE